MRTGRGSLLCPKWIMVAALVISASPSEAVQCGHLFSPSSLESRIVRLESVRSKPETADLSDLLQRLSPRDRKTLSRKFARADSAHGLRRHKLEDALVFLYSASKADTKRLSYLVNNGISGATREMILRRVESELLTHDVLTALENLGLLRSPRASEKFSEFRKRHHRSLASLSSLSMNLFTYGISGLPLYFPQHEFLKSAPRLDVQLRKRILEEGFDSVYPDLQIIYGRSARFDIAFHWAQKTFYTGLSALVVAYFASEYIPQSWYGWMMTPNDEMSEEHQVLLREAYLEWKEVIKEFDGAYPADDSPEAIERRRYLQSIPMSELRDLVENH